VAANSGPTYIPKTLNWERVKRLHTRAESLFEPRNALMEVMRQHRYLERAVEIPAAYKKTTKEFRSPIPFDQVARVVGVLTSADPAITVPPMSDAPPHVNNALKRERWLRAMFDGMNAELEGPDVDYLAIDAQVGDGLGVIKLLHYPSRYSAKRGYPVRTDFKTTADRSQLALYREAVTTFKKGAKLPFGWRDIEANRYFPIRGYDGTRQFVVEVHSIDADVLEEMYPEQVQVNPFGVGRSRTSGAFLMAQDAEENNSGNALTVYEAWSGPNPDTGDKGEWVMWTEGLNDAQEVEGILLDGGVNPFNVIPYFELPGLITSARKPEHRYLSILFPSAAIYDSLNTEITKGMNISHQHGYPTWKRMGGLIPGGETSDDLEDRERIESGVIYDMQIGGDFDIVAPPDLGSTWNSLVGFLMQMQDQVGLSSVTRGQNLGADASGYLFSQIAAAAQSIYGPMRREQEKAFAGIASALQWAVENTLRTSVIVETIGQKGATDWIELTKTDVAKYYKVNVTLEPAIPTNAIAQGQFGASMVAAGLVTKKTVRTKLLTSLIDDPEQERKGRIWEKIEESDAYIQALFEEMMVRRQGLGLDAADEGNVSAATEAGGGGGGQLPRSGQPSTQRVAPAQVGPQ
jgi:hypothetical protein